MIRGDGRWRLTRDELISRTRQLVDEGDRLVADPSMGSLRVWLQHSDDLLSTAWGTMDRYHLSWLMVGKPKDIVRGRAMTADEEAAYVREVAEQKTAALRMSLDAVERQHMPFAGETGGLAPAMPEAASTAARDRVPAVGGTRTVPAPDPIARDYILLGLRLDQRIPGLVDGYFGPADLKAQVDIEQGRPAARFATTRRPSGRASPTEVADPARRAWLDAQLVALETQAAALAGEPLPYLEHVARCFAFRPPRRPDAEFEAAAARLDDAAARRWRRWPSGWTPGIAGSRSRSTGCRPSSTRSSRASARAPRRSSACPRARTCASRSSGTSPGPATTGTTVAAARGSTSTRTCPCACPDLIGTVIHETYPGHHLEHAWKEADLVDGEGRLEASILLINTPECLISEGLADLGRTFAVPDEDAVDLLVETFERAGLAIAADRGRRPRRRRAGRGPRAGPPRAVGRPRQRRDPAPRGRAFPCRGPRLPRRRRSDPAGGGREAPRVHRAPALADVRVRLRRGRGAAAALGRRRAGRGPTGAGSPGSSTSS